MAYTVFFFFLAGGVVGSAYKIRTLLLLLSLVFVEFVIFATVKGADAMPWAILGLAVI